MKDDFTFKDYYIQALQFIAGFIIAFIFFNLLSSGKNIESENITFYLIILIFGCIILISFIWALVLKGLNSYDIKENFQKEDEALLSGTALNSGRLYLTKKNLTFYAYSAFQKSLSKKTVYPLNDIQNLETKGKFLVIKNSDNKTKKFRVKTPSKWQEAISEQLKNAQKPLANSVN